jgi:hypothetical protein
MATSPYRLVQLTILTTLRSGMLRCDTVHLDRVILDSTDPRAHIRAAALLWVATKAPDNAQCAVVSVGGVHTLA